MKSKKRPNPNPDPGVEDQPANNDAKLVENINDQPDDVTTPQGETPELGVDNIDDDDEELREALKADALGGATQVDDDSPKQTAVPQLELVHGLLPPDLSFETAIQNFKRQLVAQALRECNASRSEAAHRLKISRQYLHRLINELKVEG